MAGKVRHDDIEAALVQLIHDRQKVFELHAQGVKQDDGRTGSGSGVPDLAVAELHRFDGG
jgi:hypothetical protein